MDCSSSSGSRPRALRQCLLSGLCKTLAASCLSLPVVVMPTTPGAAAEAAAQGEIPSVNDQGDRIDAAAQAHLDAAAKAARDDFPGVLLLCNQVRPVALRLQMPSARELGGGPHDEVRESTRIFDNFYYIGMGNVNAWVVTTRAGIIVLDSLNNASDWTSVIEPSMHRLGLDPASIRYVVISHGHGDHYGGAAYLAKKYHARVMLSEPDWGLAYEPRDRPYFDPPPTRDLMIHDGATLSLGGETLRMYITPGHTLGTVSMLIPVTDHGQRHTVALWGGTGFNFPHTPQRFAQYSGSALRFLREARSAGADVPLANHPDIDGLPRKLALLKARAPSDPNPFILRLDGVERFLTALSECALAYQEQVKH
jgi:metallo-beta-lactamase class B